MFGYVNLLSFLFSISIFRVATWTGPGGGQKCYELNPEFCLSASVYFQISGGQEETDKSNSATFTVHALRPEKNELPYS